MNYEKIISVIRALVQILGAAIALGVDVTFVNNILDALNYLLSDSTTVINALIVLEGLIITIGGFFIDPLRASKKGLGVFSAKRFSDRVKGLQAGCDLPNCCYK